MLPAGVGGKRGELLFPSNEDLGFLPWSASWRGLGRSLGTAGSTGTSRAKPVRAVPAEPRPRPPPDALSQPPAWRGAQLGSVSSLPQEGAGARSCCPSQAGPCGSLRCAGGWSGARGARPARSSPAQESGPGQVLIELFVSGCCCAQVCRAAAAPFAAYRL